MPRMLVLALFLAGGALAEVRESRFENAAVMREPGGSGGAECWQSQLGHGMSIEDGGHELGLWTGVASWEHPAVFLVESAEFDDEEQATLDGIMFAGNDPKARFWVHVNMGGKHTHGEPYTGTSTCYPVHTSTWHYYSNFFGSIWNPVTGKEFVMSPKRGHSRHGVQIGDGANLKNSHHGISFGFELVERTNPSGAVVHGTLYSNIVLAPRFHGNLKDPAPCASKAGGGWTLVRHLNTQSPTFFDINDNLAGTRAWGSRSASDVRASTTDDTWSEKFPTGHNQFMFSTGTCDSWLVVNRDELLGEYYPQRSHDPKQDRCVLESSTSSTPYFAKWYNRRDRATFPEDPWVSLGDHWDKERTTILYGEGSKYARRNAHGRLLKAQNGLNVWTRWNNNAPQDACR